MCTLNGFIRTIHFGTKNVYQKQGCSLELVSFLSFWETGTQDLLNFPTLTLRHMLTLNPSTAIAVDLKKEA